MINDKYLTNKYVADLLSCTEAHIRNLIIDGDLVAIKIGARAMRISEQSLLSFIERQKINPDDLFDPDQETKQTPTDQRVARSRWMVKQKGGGCMISVAFIVA